MAVHHDKLLYGRLERLQSDFSDEETERAVAAVNALTSARGAEEQKTAKKTAGATKRRQNGGKKRD